MAAGKISEFVDNEAFSQLDKLLQQLGITKQALIDNTVAANQFNQALGSSKGIANYTEMSNAAAKAIDKVTASSNSLVDVQKQVEAAEAKAAAAAIITAQKKADAEEKAHNKYLVLLSKQQAAREAAEAKEVSAAQVKADKIAAIEAKAQASAQQKRVTLSVPGNSTPAGSTQLSAAEEEAANKKTQAEGNARAAIIATAQAENQKAAAEQATITSVNSSTAALSKEERALNTNIAAQKLLEAELLRVQTQLKGISSNTAGATSAKANLAREEVVLKAAIAQSNSTIAQQSKELASTNTSANALNARLALLKQTYNDLTREERNAADVGGVLRKEIASLDAETKQIAASQGEYNKSVGDYENAIKSAISQYVPFGFQLVQGVDAIKNTGAAVEETATGVGALGYAFAGFTIGAFAVGIASATYYLSLFANTKNKVDTYLSGLKSQFAFLGDLVTGGRKDITDKLNFGGIATGDFSGINDFGNAVGKASRDAIAAGENINKLKIQYKSLDDELSINIQRLDAQAQLDRVASKDRSLPIDQRIAKLKEADKAEDESLAKTRQLTSARIDLDINEAKVTNPLLSKRDQDQLRGGNIELANQLSLKGSNGGISTEAYESLKEGFAAQTALIQKESIRKQRIENDENNIALKGARQLNNDELELAKAKLEGEKLNAQLILNDQNQSYSARLAALQVFIAREKALVENERVTANRAPGISPTKIATNNQRAKNQDTQIDATGTSEQLRLQKELGEEIKKAAKEVYDYEVGLERQKIDNLLNDQNEQSNIIDTEKSKAIADLTDQFSQGLIGKKDYEKQIQAIDAESKGRQLQLALDTYKKIAGAQAASLALGVGNGKDLQSTGDKITKTQNSITDLATTNTQNNVKGDVTQDDVTKQAVDDAKDLLQAVVAGYNDRLKADEEYLEHKKQLISDAAEFEKNRIQSGVGTEKDKANKIALINAQELSQKEVIQAKENELKRKTAAADKVAALANIIINTEVAASKAAAQSGVLAPIFEAFIIAAGVIQAAKVAATPLPAYYTGIESAPGGPALIGDRFGSELVREPSGKMFLSGDKPVVANLQRGSKVFTHAETIKMLARPEKLNLHPINVTNTFDVGKIVESQDRTTAVMKAILQKSSKRTGVQRSNEGWGDYLRRNGVA